jgi:hypothetical protein
LPPDIPAASRQLGKSRKAKMITDMWEAYKQARKILATTVICEKCNKKYNLATHSTICPHPSIEIFLYGTDIIEHLTKLIKEEKISPDSCDRLVEAIEQAKRRKAIKIPDFGRNYEK